MLGGAWGLPWLGVGMLVGVLSVGWGLLMPLPVALGEHFDGWHPESRDPEPAGG